MTATYKAARSRAIRVTLLTSHALGVGSIWLTAAGTLLPSAAAAQYVGTQANHYVTSQGAQRQFPATSKLGVFTPDVFPQARIDGIAVMLSASARIFDRSNFLVLPQTLKGGQYRVRYTVDLEGRPDRLWLLTEAESADAR